MPLTEDALDKFVAPKLSELTKCAAKSLPETGELLSAVILNDFVHRRVGTGESHTMVFNLVRRLDQATFEYEQGRADLRAKVQQLPFNQIGLYFRALAHFEQCLASLYQFAMFWGAIRPNHKMYNKHDGSLLDRINKIYNISHHMDNKISSGEVPTDVTTPVWLLNEGIACKGVMVTFEELREELVNARIATKDLII